VALIFILGEFGKEIPLAPYLLENFVATFRSEALEVKHALLTASVKLFLKRAPEMQQMLGKVFALILEDANVEDIDLKDRASFYYRALQ
jgi:AP-4 complex subunit beta-1